MTNAAGALPEKKEDKVEKRRALGRGLASLLPGPRVVVPNSEPGRVAEAGETKVPRFTRDDSSGGSHGGGTGSGEMEASRTRVSDLQEHAADAAGPFDSAQDRQPGAAVPTSEPSSSRGEQATEVISIQAVAQERTTLHQVSEISIELIEKNPYQTRFVFEEAQLRELADSIKEHGVVQPVVVRPAEEAGRYILVLGERRLRASRMAEKETIPALVRRLSPQQAAEMTVLENVVRADLNPIEQAQAFKVLSQEFKLTQSQIAQRIGVSRESVANYMRLLRLPGPVTEYVAFGRLTFSEARELLALENPEHILRLADEVLITHPTLEQIGERVRQMNDFPAIPGAGEPKHGTARWVDPNVRAAQMEMERTLGMRVKIKDRNGKGTIVIEYSSVDDYERVTAMLRRQ